MKIFASLILLIFPFQIFAICTFKPDVKKVISLSGPMTVLLKNLNLLNHPVVRGISVFNPVSEKDYKGKVYPGGLFLGHSTLGEFSGAVVFYDQSSQLKKILQSGKAIKSVAMSTRDLLPMEVVNLSLNILKSYVDGCDKDFTAFKSLAEKTQQDLLKIIKPGIRVIFYLGAMRGDHFPELVIANDGVVKLLRKENKIHSYPSDLAYVNWSARIMSSLPENTLHVALHDSGKSDEKKIKRSSKRMTLAYPGSLVPGFTQLEAFSFWAKSL
jgi:hypothetical protein